MFIADTMPKNSFEEVLSVLHFNDNQQCPTDKNSPDYD